MSLHFAKVYNKGTSGDYIKFDSVLIERALKWVVGLRNKETHRA